LPPPSPPAPTLGTMLPLLVLLAAAAEPACRSSMKGDFNYRTCADFCKPARATAHCRYCKCQSCGFCAASAATPTLDPITGEAPQPAQQLGQGLVVRTSQSQLETPTKQQQPTMPQQQPRPKLPQLPAQPTQLADAVARPHQQLESEVPRRTKVVDAEDAASTSSSSSLPLLGAALALALVGILLALSTQSQGGPEIKSVLLQTESPRDPEVGTTVQMQLSAESMRAVRRRVLCVVFLCIQYSAYVLLRRYATGILHEPWGAASVLGAGEVIKFCLSLVMIMGDPANSEAPRELPIGARLRFLLTNSAKMAVPACMYLIMNMLGFVSLNRIDAGTFAVIQQSKIFFTALFQRCFLNRVLSQAKWCALVTLVLGVLLISLEARPGSGACIDGASTVAVSEAGTAGFGSYVVGIIAVTLDCLLSGLATVYFEKVLKTTSLTVWDRNLQLAFYSMLIYVPWSIYDNPRAPFYGWSRVTLAVALLGALGGILVAMVIKYADGLAKNISTASSIVLTTAASHMLFNGPMNNSIVIGSIVVVTAGYNYQNVQ